MVEVFKTNVKYQDHAKMLLDQIQKIFKDYKVNFDLDDCDRILRVKCTSGVIDSSRLINLIKDFGFHAEILPDEPLSPRSISFSKELIPKTLIKILGIN